MPDYIEWDGTERRLEELLVWWGTREPFEHTDRCNEPVGSMHCCEGKNADKRRNYYLWTLPFSERWQDNIGLEFGSPDGRQRIDIGDRIYYRGDYVYELVKNA